MYHPAFAFAKIDKLFKNKQKKSVFNELSEKVVVPSTKQGVTSTPQGSTAFLVQIPSFLAQTASGRAMPGVRTETTRCLGPSI